MTLKNTHNKTSQTENPNQLKPNCKCEDSWLVEVWKKGIKDGHGVVGPVREKAEHDQEVRVHGHTTSTLGGIALRLFSPQCFIHCTLLCVCYSLQVYGEI